MDLSAQADPRDARPSFRLGSIPVLVQPSFFIATLVLGFSSDFTRLASWVAVCFASILVHELGHALMIRRFGGTPGILLYAGGGLAFGNSTDRPGQQILVSVAGPAAGFLFAGLVFVLTRGAALTGPLAQVYDDLMWVNVVWGAVNLLPMLPLDGGNIFEALMSLRWPRRARMLAELATGLTFLAIVVASVVTMQFWYAVFALYWTSPVLRSLKVRLDYHRDRKVAARMHELVSQRASGLASEAVTLGSTLLGEAHTDAFRRVVAAELAISLLDCRQVTEANALVHKHFRGSEVPHALWLALDLARRGARSQIAIIEREIDAHASSEMLSVYIDACAELEERERCAARIATLHESTAPWHALLERAAVHFHQGRFEWSLLACEVGVLTLHQEVFAYNAACCLARLGRNDEAIAALEKAHELGGKLLHDMDNDADLASLRVDERWPDVRAQLLPSTSIA